MIGVKMKPADSKQRLILHSDVWFMLIQYEYHIMSILPALGCGKRWWPGTTVSSQLSETIYNDDQLAVSNTLYNKMGLQEVTRCKQKDKNTEEYFYT